MPEHRWSRGIYSPDIVGSQDHADLYGVCSKCGKRVKEILGWVCIGGVYTCIYCHLGIKPGSIEAALYLMEPQAIANLIEGESG